LVANSLGLDIGSFEGNGRRGMILKQDVINQQKKKKDDQTNQTTLKDVVFNLSYYLIYMSKNDLIYI